MAIATPSVAPGPHPAAQRQAAELAAEGADILLLSLDRTARRARGRNMTADARGPGAARAGHARATALLGKAAATWHGRRPTDGAAAVSPPGGGEIAGTAARAGR
ncbi:hypothetical protein ABZT48_06215 [Streptomyces avermitilis]|uniref:hypothetical protein n=1 Tax=Streptomyces avermitilis TaxID=33903 RepID=UPI0033BBDE68